MTWLLGTWLGRAVSGALVALLAFLGVYTAGRREGAQRAKNRMEKRDHERADEIRRRARDADGVSDPDDGWRD